MSSVVQKTVLVFILDDQRVLLSRRLNTWFGDNQFAPPGGNIDANETVEGAAAREVLEEVNLRVPENNLNLFHSDTSEANGRLFENYYLFTRTYSGELVNKEPHRHSDLDWYPLEKLPSDTMPLVLDLLKQI